jgi:hypothetical protein
MSNTYNYGGGKYILFADYKGINRDTFPIEIDGNINNPVQLKPGYQWHKFEFSFNTLHYKEVPQDSGFLATVTGIVPKDRPDMIELFKREGKKRHIVIFVNKNNQAILLGNLDEYCSLNIPVRDNKTEIIQRNEYEIIFTCLRKDHSPFYLPNLPSPNQNISAWDYTFDATF